VQDRFRELRRRRTVHLRRLRYQVITRQPAGDKDSKVRNRCTCGGINVREACIKRLLDDLGHVLKKMGGKSVDRTRLPAFPLFFEPVPKARTGIRLPSLREMVGTDILYYFFILFY